VEFQKSGLQKAHFFAAGGAQSCDFGEKASKLFPEKAAHLWHNALIDSRLLSYLTERAEPLISWISRFNPGGPEY
jgi:hypothetical protein